MSDFINTIDAYGDMVSVRAIVSRAITEYKDNKIKRIKDYGFAESSVVAVDLPECTKLEYGAFMNCDSLVSVNLPNCVQLECSAFDGCSSLESINAPLCNYFGYNSTTSAGYQFSGCKKLESIDLPKLTSTTKHSFSSCSSLKSVNLPLVTQIKERSFYYCTSLEELYLPLCEYAENLSLGYCTSLLKVKLPKLKTISTDCMKNCDNLEEVFIGGNCSIGSTVFSSDYKLKDLILSYNGVCKLSNTNALSTSGIGIGIGYIYVPYAVIESYKSATNWSVFASQFKAIEAGLYGIKPKLLGANSSTSLSLDYYTNKGSEEPAIPQVSVDTGNESLATISDVSVSDGKVNFKVSSSSTYDVSNISVILTNGDVSITESIPIRVMEVVPEPTYSVESVHTVGFSLNSDGYYEDENNNSYSPKASVCKVNFNCKGCYKLFIDYLFYPNTSKASALFSNVDSELSTGYSISSDSYAYKPNKLNTTFEQSYEYGVFDEGEHFIYIKYTKTSSGSIADPWYDGLRFKVRFEPYIE